MMSTEKTKNTNTATTDTTNTQPQLQIEKLYTKDVSFEVPEGAEAFKKNWAPNMNLDLKTNYKKLPEKDVYEISLQVSVNVTCEDVKAFVVEVDQAGIFTIMNMDSDQLDHALKAFAPNILYPYAREVISDMVSKGGFPQLCLAPVNFDMLYQHEKTKAAETSATATDA